MTLCLQYHKHAKQHCYDIMLTHEIVLWLQVNTKVEIRFVVDEADWLSFDVKQRLKANEVHITSYDCYKRFL
jgi:hypothetical protein